MPTGREFWEAFMLRDTVPPLAPRLCWRSLMTPSDQPRFLSKRKIIFLLHHLTTAKFSLVPSTNSHMCTASNISYLFLLSRPPWFIPSLSSLTQCWESWFLFPFGTWCHTLSPSHLIFKQVSTCFVPCSLNVCKKNPITSSVTPLSAFIALFKTPFCHGAYTKLGID